MDYSIMPKHYGGGGVGNKYPDEFILSYSSIPIPNETYQCVSCRFSIHSQQENVCAFGTEEGKILICDAMAPIRQEEFVKAEFCADNHVVFDLCFIPSQPNLLVSLSGASRLEMWDMERETSVQLIGHKDSVRCASIWPENPFCLLTGSRDGTIMAWDLREQPLKSYSGRKKSTASISFGRQYQFPHEGYFPITNILHLSENYFISSSTSAASGLRIWDLRYQIASEPVRTLFVPQMMSKESGVASMCWDRFHSSFFAVCTDNSIYEYVPSLKREYPVRSLRARNVNSFFVQCSASPFSDHLLCGSSHAKAFIWDLQINRRYMQDTSKYFKSSFYAGGSTGCLSNAKFVLDGHSKEVECVQWSSQGQFMATVDGENIRIWSKWAEKNDEHGYPNEIVNHHRPIKLVYPKLRSLEDIDVMSATSSQSISQKSLGSNENDCLIPCGDGDKDIILVNPSPSRSPFNPLSNLPSLYLLNSMEGTSKLTNEMGQKKAKKSIVIKSNLSFTPAQKIPRVEGHDNFSPLEQKTPRRRRNLMNEFSKFSGSGTKRRFGDTTSPMGHPSSRGSSSSTSGSAKKMAKMRNPRNDTPSNPTPSKSPSILKYFSSTTPTNRPPKHP